MYHAISCLFHLFRLGPPLFILSEIIIKMQGQKLEKIRMQGVKKGRMVLEVYSYVVWL